MAVAGVRPDALAGPSARGISTRVYVPHGADWFRFGRAASPNPEALELTQEQVSRLKPGMPLQITTCD